MTASRALSVRAAGRTARACLMLLALAVGSRAQSSTPTTLGALTSSSTTVPVAGITDVAGITNIAGVTTVVGAARLETVAQYLAAFENQYRPPNHELAARNIAEAALRGAEQGSTPRFTLNQDLEWDAFLELSLGVEAGLELPLYSSTAAAELDLAELDLAVQRHAEQLSQREARAAFLLDLANLAVIGWAQELVAEAVRGVHSFDLPWLGLAAAGGGPAPPRGMAAESVAPTVQAAPSAPRDYVPPAERGAFELTQRLFDTEAWLSVQSEALYLRLATALSRPVTELTPPSLEALARHLGDRAPVLPPASTAGLSRLGTGSCSGTPLAVSARLRHAQNVAHDDLLALPDLSLGLSARLGYAFGPWSPGQRAAGSGTFDLVGRPGSPGGELSGALAVEARYVLPDGWPLVGNVSVELRPDRLDQSLDLSWPPLPRPRQVAVDREHELALELQNIGAELRALRRAWLLARDDRARLERQLSWLLLDMAPDLDEAALRSLVQAAVTSPSLTLLQSWPAASPYLPGNTGSGPVDLALGALKLVELRLQIAFARLAEMSAQVQYLAVCPGP